MAQLPFLFKVLSVRTALSIQAHPDKVRSARRGKPFALRDLGSVASTMTGCTGPPTFLHLSAASQPPLTLFSLLLSRLESSGLLALI
jgi:hypothetical protein